jgi:hypothetical protein
MPDPNTFESRLADAMRRYSDQAPTDVDAMALAREIASGSAEEVHRRPRWWPFGRTHQEQGRSRTMFIASGATAVLAIAVVGSSLALLSVAPAVDEEPASPPAAVTPLNARVVAATTSSAGYQAGSQTDLLFDLGISLDPTVPGRTLKAGQSIRMTLPEEFTSSGLPVDVPSACDAAAAACNTGYLQQGWPQSYFPTTTDYYTLEMDGSHTFVFTATQDLGPTAEAPGIKQIHLMAPGFTNPATIAEYQILLEADTGPDGEPESDIISFVPLTNSGNYNFAPTSVYTEPGQDAAFGNPVYQTASVAGSPEWPWDFIIFDAEEGPWGQIELRPMAENTGTWVPEGPTVLDHGEFVGEQYTIGGWWIEGPEGATGASVTAEPSTLIDAPISGDPATRLTVHFTAGDLPGRYVFHYGYSDGQQMIVDVTE